jgi:uncharacterized protein (DUF2384 family)
MEPCDSLNDRGPYAGSGVSAATITKLVAQVQSMVDQSGRPEGFDAREWLNTWLHTPVAALGSRPPIELLETPEGVALVSSTLARMQSGAYM